MVTNLSLYIHIPFCIRKCAYCDFLSYPADDSRRQDYLHALEREIKAAGTWAAEHGRAPYHVDTIFLGGGTPSVLTPAQMTRLLETVFATFCVSPDAEITTECNPGTVTQETLRAYREAGLNRLSIGVQTFHEEELRTIGRIHSRQQAINCCESARRAGFDNVSLDLMSALPGQTPQSFMENLEMAAALAPEHLSCYSLILEEGTPLLARYEAGQLPELPDEETDRAMVHETAEFLAARGYHQYEISNYARPGRECRHNIGYWTGHEYLGLGLGSSSMMCLDGRWTRFRNTTDPAAYEAYAQDIAALHRDVTALSPEDRMEEYMFLGLRMNAGVREALFLETFGREIDHVYPGITAKYVRSGLLGHEDGRIFLTERGRDLANTVMADYMLTV